MLKIYTGTVFHRHNTGFDHPERPARLDAAIEGVGRAGLADRVVTDVAEHADTARIIAKVHSEEYARDLDSAVRAGNRYFHSLDNPISSATFSAARAAVGTSLAAAADVWSGGSKRAFIVAR